MQRPPGMWGIAGDPTPRRLSGTAKGSEPWSQRGSQGARGRGRRAPESFRHIPASTLPATRPKGTRCPAPNVGSRPLLRSPADEGRFVRISQDHPPPTSSGPALAATLPPPPPRPSGRLPPAGAAAGLPRSRARSSAIPPGPAAAGRAAGIVAAGRRTAREPGKEGGGERGREGGGSRGEGAAGRGSRRSPPERTRAQPRDHSGRAAPGAGGRVRRSRRASEQTSEERAGGGRGAGAESVPSERGQEGRGRAGPGCQPPPLAAGPSALQSLTPVPLASWGPSVSSRWMLRQPCAGAARLRSIRTISQMVRWRPPS